MPYYISDKSMVLEVTRELLYQDRLENSVRLLGISLSNLNTEQEKSGDNGLAVSVQLKFAF